MGAPLNLWVTALSGALLCNGAFALISVPSATCRLTLEQIGPAEEQMLMEVCRGRFSEGACARARAEVYAGRLAPPELPGDCAALLRESSRRSAEDGLRKRRAVHKRSAKASLVMLDATVRRKAGGEYLVRPAASVGYTLTDPVLELAPEDENAHTPVFSVDQTVPRPPDSDGNPYNEPVWRTVVLPPPGSEMGLYVPPNISSTANVSVPGAQAANENTPMQQISQVAAPSFSPPADAVPVRAPSQAAVPTANARTEPQQPSGTGSAQEVEDLATTTPYAASTVLVAMMVPGTTTTAPE